MLKKSLNRKINLLSKFFVFKTNVTADENMAGKRVLKNKKKCKKNFRRAVLSFLHPPSFLANLGVLNIYILYPLSRRGYIRFIYPLCKTRKIMIDFTQFKSFITVINHFNNEEEIYTLCIRKAPQIMRCFW